MIDTRSFAATLLVNTSASLIPKPAIGGGSGNETTLVQVKPWNSSMVWIFNSLVPRPSPSFPSLVVQLSGRGPGTFSHVSDVTGRKMVERL